MQKVSELVSVLPKLVDLPCVSNQTSLEYWFNKRDDKQRWTTYDEDDFSTIHHFENEHDIKQVDRILRILISNSSNLHAPINVWEASRKLEDASNLRYHIMTVAACQPLVQKIVYESG